MTEEDLVEVEKTINEIGEVALVCIDPITAFMGGKMDSHKATEVRSQLGPLKDFAERNDVGGFGHHPSGEEHQSKGHRSIHW